jgi:hypothetical protein
MFIIITKFYNILGEIIAPTPTSLGDEDWRFNDYDFYSWN